MSLGAPVVMHRGPPISWEVDTSLLEMLPVPWFVPRNSKKDEDDLEAGLQVSNWPVGA